MKVIIVGMGRMGSSLANRLDEKGQQVIAIDKDLQTFENLSADFSGLKITGSALEEEVLKKAEIDRVDALVSCVNADETNAVIARVAKNDYRVPKVIARIYDPEKADVYRHLGIQAISALDWGVNRTMEMLSYDHIDGIYDMGDGSVSFVRMNVPAIMDGQLVDTINVPGSIGVVALVRHGRSFIPISGAQLETDDVVYLAVEEQATNRLKKIFGKQG